MATQFFGTVRRTPVKTKKVTIPDEVIATISTQNDFENFVANCAVTRPGEEPDTNSAFEVPFERSGILPCGWHVNPYDGIRYTMDQIGLAKLFADLYQDKCRYCNSDDTWYVFDSEYGWRKDPGKTQIMEIIRDFKTALKYAANLIDDNTDDESSKNESYKKVFEKHFLGQLQSANQVRNLLTLAASEHSFSASEMDTAIDILAAQNGIIQLYRNGTFEFRPFSPEDMSTRHMATSYDPDAKCPVWERFIFEILNGNTEIIRFFKLFLGQMLFGRNEQKSFGILLGEKTNNGKSTMMTALKEMMGDYAVTVTESLIQKKSKESVGDMEQRAKTKGARLVTLPEPSQDLQVDVAGLKNMTGNAPMSARFLNENSFDFIPGFTLVIDTNFVLQMRDMSIFKRGSVVMFRFNQSFTGDRADATLPDKLRSEAAGILNWLLEGWADYCAATPEGSRWVLPQSMQDDIKQYWHDSDTTARFLEECYEVTRDSKDRVRRSSVYQEYRRWSNENGDCPKSAKVIQPDILRKLVELQKMEDDDLPLRKVNGDYCYTGIRLLQHGVVTSYDDQEPELPFPDDDGQCCLDNCD